MRYRPLIALALLTLLFGVMLFPGCEENGQESPGITITDFTPKSGPVGTKVIITGTNFSGVDHVEFGLAGAQYTVDSNTQITATVPEDARTAQILVQWKSDVHFTDTAFTVTAPDPDPDPDAPTILDFTPKQGTFGTVVTITGTNFNTVTDVSVGLPVSYTIDSDTQITATINDMGCTGPVMLTYEGGTVFSADTFTFLPGPPPEG